MKRYTKSIILIIGLLLIIGLADSQNNIYLEDLINEIGEDQDKPINAVIAIDKSSSIDDGLAKSVAYTIIETIKALNNSENKIGYVGWNHEAENYKELTNNYTEIIDDISLIRFGGNTCLEKGINRSVSLIGVPNMDKRNMIIILSDGDENCNLTGLGVFNCTRIKQILPAYIDIRAIQIGTPIGNNEIISCLNKQTSNVNENDIISGITEDIPFAQNINNYFNVKAIGSRTKYQETRTKVNISKIIDQGLYGGPRIKIRIETPDGPNVQNSLVLALDSSGSLGNGGNPSYGENLRKAIMPTLENIKTQLPKSNVSIISWDDNIDFSYSPLTYGSAKTANLVPIGKAIEDIRRDKVFVDYPISIFGYELPILLSYPINYYKCTEYEATDFTVGLNGAIDILNKAHPKQNNDENNTDLNSIIFIAARSEFIPFSKDTTLIEEAKKNNYHIYTLGIGAINKSFMEDELFYAASQTGGKYHYSSGSDSWSKKAIVDEVNSIVEEIRDMTLLNNVELVDTVYPYLDIIVPSIKATVTRGKESKTLKITPNIVRNVDGTTTVVLNIKENLSRNTALEISMDTKFNLSMPVDVTNERRNLYWNWNINRDTRPSTITYKWHNNRLYRMNLPENSITFR
jgi:hypothetical protein